jgi:hypothetical protein
MMKRKLGERGENSGKQTLDKYMLGKSHFADEKRLRRRGDFADEERLRRKFLL